MNRVGGIGIAILIIVVIIGVVYYMSSSNTSEDNLPTVEEIILNESISIEEEIVPEELEQTVTAHSVELEESMGFKTP